MSLSNGDAEMSAKNIGNYIKAIEEKIKFFVE